MHKITIWILGTVIVISAGCSNTEQSLCQRNKNENYTSSMEENSKTYADRPNIKEDDRGEEGEEYWEEKKIVLDEYEFFNEYSGFLDQIDNIEEILGWTKNFSMEDYDGDGRAERIYVENKVTEEKGKSMQYSIHFANGDLLKLEESFEAMEVPYFQGIDIDGDGSNEIIFKSAERYSTVPESMVKIYFYYKNESGYIKMPAPGDELDGKKEQGVAGYPVIVEALEEDEVVLRVKDSEFKSIIKIEDYEITTGLTLMGLFRQYMLEEDIIGEYAWMYEVEEYEGKQSVILYEKILGRYTDQNVLIRVIYEDNTWKIVDIDVKKTPINIMS